MPTTAMGGGQRASWGASVHLRSIGGTAVALLLTTLPALSAAAAPSQPAAKEPAPRVKSVKTAKGTDPICEQAVRVEKSKGNARADDSSCATLTTTTVDEPVEVTPEIARAHGDPVLPTGERLSATLASRTVYYQNWSQERRGLYYVNWYEKHQGLYYFDGVYAWVSPRYGWDAHGYHQCDLGYGILYDIQVKDCSVRGNMTSNVIANDTFRVHVVYKGVPLYATHSMAANLGRNGL